jgi:ankyrin repeat protein
MTSQRPDDVDLELLKRYRDASRAEPSSPSEAVRDAILAESRRVARVNAGKASPRRSDDSQPAPNQSGWKFAAFGTLSAAVLAAFLVIPRFRGGPENAAPAQTAAPAAKQAPARGAVPPTTPLPLPTLGAPEARLPASMALRKADAQSRVSSASSDAPTPAAAAPAGTATAEAARSDALVRNAAEPAAQMRLQADRPETAGASAQESSAGNRSLLPEVKSGELARIASLLDQGAAVEEQDEMGRSPLMLATIQGRLDAVQLLLDRGANPNAADHSGRTPLQEARLRKFAQIEVLLERAGAH